MITPAYGSAGPSPVAAVHLCVSEDPLFGGEELTDDRGTERTVLGPEKKLFFSPRSFGQGESGESSDHNSLLQPVLVTSNML